MERGFAKIGCVAMSAAAAIAFSTSTPGVAAAGKAAPVKKSAAVHAPHTPQELAQQYMASFNSKDSAAIKKLMYPLTVKSGMQDMMNEMSAAEMAGGTKYNRFEITPAKGDMKDAQMGPDGLFYKPTIQPTHVVKFIAETKNGSSSTSMPIGVKNGVYFIATIGPAAGAQPVYKFGWDRYTMPGTTWSVMLPNEPEPGRAALEKQYGADALKDPDVYGVVKNTASIKTAQHWFWTGAEGKRVNADDNHEHYRAAATTYEPETLKQWFSDPKKNLDDDIDVRVREHDGKLVSVQDIDLAGAPGREFEIRAKDGTLVLGRVYWIKDALYELTFDTKDETPDHDKVEKFLSSLEVK